MRGKYKIGEHWAPAYRLKGVLLNFVDEELSSVSRYQLEIKIIV